ALTPSNQLLYNHFMNKCPLCFALATPFRAIKGKEYLSCGSCGGIFLAPQYHLSLAEEKERYLTHNNDVNDPRYQEFVRPIVDAVVKSFGAQDHGLDFGCGTGPVISKLLTDRGYSLLRYDPFFYDQSEALTGKYDFIVCSEVIEHFRQPAKEFKLLKDLLKVNGALFCLTERFTGKTDFANWYYKNDPTHLFFYQQKTLEWLRDNFGFSSLEISGRLAILSA
ncbi:MAG: class I SAM-dependent methyltransferase, partial [bacterium]